MDVDESRKRETAAMGKRDGGSGGRDERKGSWEGLIDWLYTGPAVVL